MSVYDMVLLVAGASRGRRSEVSELGARLREALVETFAADGVSLSVIVNDGAVSVRGEVDSLDEISRASRVIDRFRGEIEIDNLVRVRPLAVAGLGVADDAGVHVVGRRTDVDADGVHVPTQTAVGLEDRQLMSGRVPPRPRPRPGREPTQPQRRPWRPIPRPPT